MRLLSITAGAAGMYCGSCLRDNALAAALMRRGHDVLHLPLYTPTLTDEANVSASRVFFGGISVYLEQVASPFRWTPGWLDRLWDSGPVLRLAARRAIRVDPESLGALTVSVLKGEHGYQRKELDKLIGWLRSQPRPDVVTLPNSLLIALARPLEAALGAPVCCTLQGEDLFLEGLPDRWRREALGLIRERVGDVHTFLPVSRYYRDFMSGYLEIPADRMRVLPLGVALDGYSAERPPVRPDRPFTVGYLARVAPEKGLETLCEAFRLMRQRYGVVGARLEVAGYLAAEHRGYLANLTTLMASWGLADDFAYRGTLDRSAKGAFLRGLDVLSVPGAYAEPKGLYLLEAMANGTPVVQPRIGAFPEILEATGGGLLVEPGDPDRLASVLARLAGAPGELEELRRRGAHGVREHYSVDRMADRALAVFADIVSGPPVSASASALADDAVGRAVESATAGPRGET